MNQRKLFFFHIPKTAGTSFRELLQSQYSQKDVAHCYANKERDKELREAIASSKSLISGHLDFSAYPLVHDNYKTVCFFRDPIDRCISHYLHMLRSQGPRMMELKESVHSLPDFLKTSFGSNLQARFMDGSFEKSRGSDLQDVSLDQAAENMEKLNFIGLAERMDESISKINSEFSFNLKNAERLNVASNSALFQELKSAYRDQIAEANSMDVELYKKALKIFEAKP